MFLNWVQSSTGRAAWVILNVSLISKNGLILPSTFFLRTLLLQSCIDTTAKFWMNECLDFWPKCKNTCVLNVFTNFSLHIFFIFVFSIEFNDQMDRWRKLENVANAGMRAQFSGVVHDGSASCATTTAPTNFILCRTIFVNSVSWSQFFKVASHWWGWSIFPCKVGTGLYCHWFTKEGFL